MVLIYSNWSTSDFLASFCALVLALIYDRVKTELALKGTLGSLLHQCGLQLYSFTKKGGLMLATVSILSSCPSLH